MPHFSLERTWDIITNLLLVSSISLTLALFLTNVSSNLVTFSYILLFTSFLTSDKMGGTTMSADGKAFSYFAIYIFLFMHLLDYVLLNFPRMLLLISLMGLLIVGAIILWQVLYFASIASSPKRRSRVYIFGLLATLVLISCWLVKIVFKQPLP